MLARRAIKTGIFGQIPLNRQIANMFRSGEQGFWYDPSDWSTLFQDASGTTPVTSVGQPVGLLLDKRFGLINGSETFSDANITFIGESSRTSAGVYRLYSSAGAYSLVDKISGALIPTAGKVFLVTFVVNSVAVAGAGIVFEGVQSTPVIPATVGSKSCIVFATGSSTIGLKRQAGATDIQIGNLSVRELPGNHASQPTSTSRPILSAQVNKLLGTTALATQSITTLATTHTFRFEGDGSVVLSGSAIGAFTAGTYSIVCAAGTLMLAVTGSVLLADFREYSANSIVPGYQRVTTATDYETSGFPVYLKADGVDDGMVTGSVDFTGTGKMTVVAGVRKVSDAATGLLLELSSNYGLNVGAFALFAPLATAPSYCFSSRGTASSDNFFNGYASPVTSVISAASDILSDSNTVKVDGLQAQALASDQGSGNFGNYPLYLFRRGGASLPFNGNFYGLIIRGAQTSAADIAKAEKWMASKTGVAL